MCNNISVFSYYMKKNGKDKWAEVATQIIGNNVMSAQEIFLLVESTLQIKYMINISDLQ